MPNPEPEVLQSMRNGTVKLASCADLEMRADLRPSKAMDVVSVQRNTSRLRRAISGAVRIP